MSSLLVLTVASRSWESILREVIMLIDECHTEVKGHHCELTLTNLTGPSPS